MPTIQFPNVPLVPGVPDLRRSAVGLGAVSGVLGALAGIDYFGVLDGVLGPKWGLYDKEGRVAIEPDSVISLEYRGEQRICTYPVEDGSFASYNKVAVPYDIRLVMSCSGQGSMTREFFLISLGWMKDSTELFDLVTPDATYENVNLVRFDYRRQSSNGVQLLLADVQFQEVRVTATATYISTAQPSGSQPESIGPVNTVDPTTDQKAAVGSIS